MLQACPPVERADKSAPSARQRPASPINAPPVTLTMDESAPAPAPLPHGPFPGPMDVACLNVGEPHPDAARIQSIMGVPMTAQGFANFIARAMPGAHAITTLDVSPASGRRGPQTSDDLVTSTKLRDGKGEPIGSFLIVFRRYGDALQLENGVDWVEPKHRGDALTSRMLLNFISLVRGLSAHPDARITQGCGGAGESEENFQKIGEYWWAHSGVFEFAKPEELAALQAGFGKWVSKQNLKPEVARSLLEHSSRWTHPYDLATTHVEGLTFPVKIGDEAPRPCSVGKAFLLSPDAVAKADQENWSGVCYPNRHAPWQATAGMRVLRYSIEKSAAARQMRDAEWSRTLATGAPQEKLRALDSIGQFGGVEWLPRLRAVVGEREIGDRAREAIDRIEGTTRLTDLHNIFSDSARPSLVRASAFANWRTCGGQLTADVVRSVTRGADDTLRYHALMAVANQPDLAVPLAAQVLQCQRREGSFPIVWRAPLLDSMRILMQQGEIDRLRRARQTEADPCLRHSLDECIEAADGKPPRGTAALPIRQYPAEAWSLSPDSGK